MGIISKPNTFSPSTTASSSQVNANFDTIYNEFNGSIAAANLATDSVTTAKIADNNVTTSKLADLNVTTAKLAANAVTPAKRSGGFKVGALSVTATGSLAVTGIGFTPKLVMFTYVSGGANTTIGTAFTGVMDASGNQWTASWRAVEGGDASGNGNTSSCILYIAANGGADVTAAFTSMDADGFTINVSAKTTSIAVGYIAFG